MESEIWQRKLVTLPVVRIESGSGQCLDDLVAAETPLTVVLNGTEVATILSSLGEPEELALGFLLSEGIIAPESESYSLKFNPRSGSLRVSVPEKYVLFEGDHGARLVGSGCSNAVPYYRGTDATGIHPVDSRLEIYSHHLTRLMKEFQKSGLAFLESGGTHSCALCNQESILLIVEDIGRHNALDRIAGRCFMRAIPTADKIVLTTGRISSEIVFKVARLHAPVIVSRSAPTSLAVDAAGKLGITVVGFARGKRMNVYTHAQRVVQLTESRADMLGPGCQVGGI